MSQLTSLEELWMSANGFATFDALQPLVALPSLHCIYLEHNPIYQEFDYRKRVAALLPKITQLDANQVPGRTRQAAK